MKIERKTFLDRLEIAAKVCPSRTPKDILKWVKIEYDGTTLTITATDQEVGVRLTMIRGVEGAPETFVIPAGQTVRVLKELQTESVDLIAEEKHVAIRGGRDTIRVNRWADPSEFPTWTHEGTEYTVQAGEFKEAVARCLYAVCNEPQATATHGVNLRIEDNRLTVQTTDGRRAAYEPVDCEGDDAAALVLPKGLTVASQVMAGDCTLSVGPSSVEIRTPGETVYCRQVEGRFPSFKGLDKGKYTAEIKVSVAALTGFFRRAILATDVESVGVELELTAETLRAKTAAEAKGAADVELPVFSDKACKLSINGSYMLEMLRALDPNETLTWSMSPTMNRFRVLDWTGLLMALVG